MIFDSIKKLIIYGLEKGLIEKEDVIYTQNMIIDTLGLDEYVDSGKEFSDIDLEETLSELLDYADSLDAKDHELAEKTYRVFLVFYKLEYGSFVPGAGDSERVLALFEDIQKRLEILKDRKN